MFSFIKKYQAFFIVASLWLLIGQINGAAGIFFISISIIYFLNQGRNTSALFLFFFCLIFSDSRLSYFQFAKDARIPLLLIFIGFLLFGQKKIKIQKNIKTFYLLPFFLFALIGSLFGPIPSLAIQKLLSYGLMIFFGLSFVHQTIASNVESFQKDISYFVLFILGLGFILAIFQPNVVFFRDTFRYNGVFGNPNGLGIFCTLNYFFFRILDKKRKNKLNTIVLFFLVFSIILTQARSSIFAIIIFEFIHFLTKQNVLLGMLGGLIFVILLSLFDPVEIFYSLNLNNVVRTDNLSTGSGRFLAWKFASTQIWTNPIFGNGFAYGEYFMGLNKDKFLYTEHQGGVHNSFLSLLINTGFVGFTCIILFFLTNLLSEKSNRIVSIPLIFGIGFSSFFEDWLIGSMNSFFIFFLMLLVLVNIPSRHLAK